MLMSVGLYFGVLKTAPRLKLDALVSYMGLIFKSMLP